MRQELWNQGINRYKFIEECDINKGMVIIGRQKLCTNFKTKICELLENSVKDFNSSKRLNLIIIANKLEISNIATNLYLLL